MQQQNMTAGASTALCTAVEINDRHKSVNCDLRVWSGRDDCFGTKFNQFPPEIAIAQRGSLPVRVGEASDEVLGELGDGDLGGLGE
jgi:hypothetical protein